MIDLFVVILRPLLRLLLSPPPSYSSSSFFSFFVVVGWLVGACSLESLKPFVVPQKGFELDEIPGTTYT
jgi:hypothetical protein